VSAVSFGSFELIQKLGAGGMGEVFLAQKPNGPVVVLKRILAAHSTNEAFKTRFLSEISAVAKLNHPNIARVFELGIVDEQLFFTMEYLRGNDLRHLLAKTTIPVPVAIRVIHDALCALRGVHEAQERNGKSMGLLHRDITPANLFVGIDGVTRLIDFGLAQSTSDDESISGTVHYLAPEVIDGEPLTAQSELFALSSVVYELLTGRKRFEGESDLEILNLILDCQSVSFDSTKAFNSWFHTLSHRNPKERFSSASKAIEALELTCFIPPHAQVRHWMESFQTQSTLKTVPQIHNAKSNSVTDLSPAQANALIALSQQTTSISLEDAKRLLNMDELDALDTLSALVESGNLKSIEADGEMKFQVVNSHGP
jgi:serine/threonine protein kinase